MANIYACVSIASLLGLSIAVCNDPAELLPPATRWVYVNGSAEIHAVDTDMGHIVIVHVDVG